MWFKLEILSFEKKKKRKLCWTLKKRIGFDKRIKYIGQCKFEQKKMKHGKKQDADVSGGKKGRERKFSENSIVT